MTVQSTLLFSTLFALVSASIYAYVGWRLSKRVIASSEATGLAVFYSMVVWSGSHHPDRWSSKSVWRLRSDHSPLFFTATYINLLVICSRCGVSSIT